MRVDDRRGSVESSVAAYFRQYGEAADDDLLDAFEFQEPLDELRADEALASLSLEVRNALI